MASRPVGRLAKADDAAVDDDCVFDDAGAALCTSEGLIGVLADEPDGEADVVVVSTAFVGVEGFAGVADSAAEAAAARASL